MRRFLPLAILLGFFIELAVMIMVGQRIGVISTLLLIVAGAVLGGSVIRSAGFGLMAALRRPGQSARFATRDAAAGFLFMLAGLLLLLPGFVSDILGLLLLPMAVRQWLAEKLMGKLGDAVWRREAYSPGKMIEGEAIEIDGRREG
ncbi:MAG TPA: FxsA family protein [Aestuariivirga sp.]|nr:FxsA family protein [Aestuariivirga sp.]